MKDSFSAPLNKSFSQKKLVLIIVIVCQVIALANGVMTICVDFLSKQVLGHIFQNVLPQLTLLFSLSWRNWKIMEALTENLVLGGNSVPYRAQVNYHLSALAYEAFESSAEIKESVGKMSNLTNDCLTSGKISSDYDQNLFLLDKLAVAATEKTDNHIFDELKSMQNSAVATLYANSIALGVVTLLRIGQIYFSPKENRDLKANPSYWAGTTSMFMLSALESTSFIILTKIRLHYIDVLVTTEYPLYESAWKIKYLDPILTGSAFRYTFSEGDATWNDRYNEALPPLEAAYNVTSVITSPEVQGLNELNANANQVLIVLETDALTNTTLGKDALTGLSYTSNKAVYLFAVDSLLILQERKLYAGLSSTQSMCEALLFFAAVLTSMSMLLFISEVTKLFNELRSPSETTNAGTNSKIEPVRSSDV